MRCYWSTLVEMGVSFKANIMQRARFEKIRQNLRFYNNVNQCEVQPNMFDRAFKI